jgi:sensor c-di-GMP phosphodiesterase-like protein
MRIHGQRVRIGWLATSVLALFGVAAGTAIGGALVVLDTKLWLSSHSRAAAVQADSSLSEAQKILTVLKLSPYVACSDEEIAYLRGLVFQSQLVKDAGRLHGDGVACSATGSKELPLAAQTQTSVHLKDGSVQSSLAAPAVAGSAGADMQQILLMRDGSYVLFNSKIALTSVPIPLSLLVSTNGAGAQSGPGVVDGPINRFKDSSGHVGNILYATRCAPQGMHCATATTTINAAWRGEASLIPTSAFGGGMAGILIGFAFSFRYRRRRELNQQLKRAAEGDELTVAYQPIVDLETQQIVGAEALARWKDEEGNEVRPDVFVKIAEEFGFVGAITKTVLKRTLRDFASTMRERPDFRMSINVAAADLTDPEFLPMLSESLKRARVSPKSLAIELTERSASNSDAAMETIRTLRKLGHSIHIDDFGTGYSNLDKLLWLFADTIKIDKAFTGGIGTESAGATILPQILAMAESLNLEVVVEGVETYRQADYFTPGAQRIYGQGWLYGRPVSAQDFLALLAGEQSILSGEEAAEAFTTRPGSLRIVSQQVA